MIWSSSAPRHGFDLSTASQALPLPSSRSPANALLREGQHMEPRIQLQRHTSSSMHSHTTRTPEGEVARRRVHGVLMCIHRACLSNPRTRLHCVHKSSFAQSQSDALQSSQAQTSRTLYMQHPASRPARWSPDIRSRPAPELDAEGSKRLCSRAAHSIAAHRRLENP